ncbi:MAG: NAD(P)/FAD-dependent oxidoreductase [Pseudomonadota bacterium]
MLQNYDVVIAGAGAAGLMCAIEAGKRGRSVLLLDHAKKPAEKIRISGGGRCNFTNLHCGPDAFLSKNPHFCKSALRQYTQHDFIALMEQYGIAYHEKTLGQLFCDHSAKDIINMLLTEAENAGVELFLETSIFKVSKSESGFDLETSRGKTSAPAFVIATGGLSIPKMGASGFAYDIADQFNIPVTETRAALVPLTFEGERLNDFKSLAGVALPALARFGKTAFSEAMLYTHRGLSGPAILQISSYWDHKTPLTLNMMPDIDVYEFLKSEKAENPKAALQTALGKMLPKRLAAAISDRHDSPERLADLADKKLQKIAAEINDWQVLPDGTEGYRTAEVTLGGIDTDALSSKTMECKSVAGLYFIGECVDVTGHLGGYNFQWAWSSGYVAGQSI